MLERPDARTADETPASGAQAATRLHLTLPLVRYQHVLERPGARTAAGSVAHCALATTHMHLARPPGQKELCQKLHAKHCLNMTVEKRPVQRKMENTRTMRVYQDILAQGALWWHSVKWRGVLQWRATCSNA